jgi:predicted PurR-regulated permease PerM
LIRPNLAGSTSASNSSRLLTLIAVVVVIVGLYFGRQVLIPLALAVVLAFLFSPVVDGLQKCHFARVPAVLTVLLLAFTLMAFVGWIVTGQLMDLVDQFPSYQSTIHDKIQSIRLPSNSRLKNVTNTVSELSAELTAASDSSVSKKAVTNPRSRPIAVQLAQPPENAPQYLRAVIGPLTGVLETSAMVIVFTLFMLVKREDLRNRVIRLAGQDQLNMVTQALHDASRRLSRYLLLQFLVNIAYGTIFGVGTYLFGIPHALLWGVLACFLRFVPYVGAPIAAAFPIAMAFAVFPGWYQGLFVFVLYAVVELILSNFIEPWLYGSHTGISSLAILVAAVFWVILWGPVGLILSTPLTVCLILIGRYVPQLSFLEVVLGDEAVLPVEAHFYQRLLALDQEEARDIADAFLKEKPIGSFYDSVLIPALSLSEQDRHLNSLEERTAIFVSQSARELIEELGERSVASSVDTASDELAPGTPRMFDSDESNGREMERNALAGLRVICIPAGDEADELVAIMAEQLLTQLGCDVRRLPIVNREVAMEEIATDLSQVVFVSALPPFAAGHARSLCKLIRPRFPGVKIVLGLWGYEGGIAKAQDRAGFSCGEMLAVSLQQAISLLVDIKQSVVGNDESELDGSQLKGASATTAD